MKRAVVLALSTVAGVAHAEPARDAPDPTVEEAGDANLEPTENRQGLTFTVAPGGGLLVGFGIDDSVGRGGSLSLRLGQVAGRRMVATFEISVTAVLHKATTTSSTEPNTNTSFAGGAQYYVNPSMWLRLSGGLGVYQRRNVSVGGNPMLVDHSLVGPVAIGGLGVDLLRFKATVVGIEVSTSAMINRDGVLMANNFAVGWSFD